MANVLNLEVVTPERVVLREETTSLIVPATEGFLGVQPNHAPLITGLKPGIIKFRQGEEVHALSISNGFMEVSHNVATILADTAEKPEDINVERARAAKERAEQRLHERHPGIDEQRAELALNKALARIEAVEFKIHP